MEQEVKGCTDACFTGAHIDFEKPKHAEICSPISAPASRALGELGSEK